MTVQKMVIQIFIPNRLRIGKLYAKLIFRNIPLLYARNSIMHVAHIGKCKFIRRIGTSSW